jgi:hypothetical protein
MFLPMKTTAPKKTTPKAPYIITTHDWISLVIPAQQARLTTARGGERASGPVPRNVFATWCRLTECAPGPVAPSPKLTDAQNKAVSEIMGQPKDALGFVTTGARIQGFLDRLEAIWPGHSTPVEIPVFVVGQDVTFNFGARKGLDKGKVEKVKGANVTVRFQREGLISMTAILLASG